MKNIYFDMDGTIADLYGQADWLTDLRNERTKPYRNAKPLVDMRKLGKILNTLQGQGYRLGIISWTSKSGSRMYQENIAYTKRKWLEKHLGSVRFDEMHIINYGTPKSSVGDGILFDDEERNRREWGGFAFDESKIIEILEGLAK